MSNKMSRMGTDPILKVLITMAVPGLVSMGVNSLYVVVDRIFIGQGIGSLGLAAVAISLPIFFVIMAYGLGISIGAGALIGRCLGETNFEGANKAMNQSFGLAFISSLVFTTLTLFFLHPILNFMQVSPELYPYAESYLRVIFIGALFTVFSMMVGECLRAEGHANSSMVIMLIGAVLNVALDPLAIFVFKWGLAGVAWATIFCQVVATVAGLWVIQKRCTHLKVNLQMMIPQWPVVKAITTIGSSSFITQFIFAIQNNVVNGQIMKYGKMSAYGGDLALSAYGTVMTIVMFVFSLAIGLGFGSRPLIAYNYGAKNYRRLKQSLVWATLLTGGFLAIGWVIMEFFAVPLMSIFAGNNDQKEAFVELGSQMLRYFVILFPLATITFTTTTYFQSAGKPLWAILASLMRQVIIFIPLVYLLPHFWGFNGIIYTFPITDFISASVLLFLLIREVSHLGKQANLPM